MFDYQSIVGGGLVITYPEWIGVNIPTPPSQIQETFNIQGSSTSSSSITGTTQE